MSLKQRFHDVKPQRRSADSLMEGEKILAIAPQFNHDGITRTRGDLIFTTNRILFIKTAGRIDLTEALLGSQVASVKSRRRSDELKHKPLQDLVGSSEMAADYLYIDLEKVEIKPRIFTRSLVVIYPRNGRKKKYWGKRRHLLEVISAIPEARAYGAPLAESTQTGGERS